MAGFRSFIFVVLVAPLVHAQIGPAPEWDNQPAAVVSPARAPEPVLIKATTEDPAPAIESLPLGVPSPDAAASTSKTPEQQPGMISSTILPLALVIAVIIGLAALARAFMRSKGGLVASLGAGGRAPSGVLEVLGRYPVGRGSTLVLLKLDRRVLLVAQSKAGKLGGAAFATLSEITDPEDVASVLLKTRDESSESISSRFTALLGAFERQQPAVEHIAVPNRTERNHRAPASSFEPQPVAAPEQQGAIASVRQRLADMRSSEGAE